MRKIREILRQKWALGRTHREVAQSLSIGLGTVSGVERRARAAGLSWTDVEGLADEALETRLYPPGPPGKGPRAWPDCGYLHVERRKPGVTLELLHLEYLEQHPDGYRYTQFCEIYRRWLTRRGLSMRQVHRAGEKCFVDYAGQKPKLIDPATGEVIEVELFVAVLGASNYTYAEATRTQQVPDWIASHQRAFTYFEGVPGAVVPDQLKSGVTGPCRYEPGLQTLEQLQALKLTTMAATWSAQPQNAELTALSFDDRFALLVDAEWRARENKRLGRALQEAKLKLPQASIEAIDYPARRELDKALIRQLATCRWVDEHQQVLISGATGVGKTFIACALGNQARRKGYRARYWAGLPPLPRLCARPGRRDLRPLPRPARPCRRAAPG
jgi:transposase